MSYAFVETTQSLPKPKLLPSMHLWWIESLHFQSRAFVSSTRIHCNSRLESWKWNFLIRAISIPPKRACSQLQKKSTGIISKNLRKTIQEFDYRTLTYIDNKMKLAQTKQCCPAVARDATKLEANVLLARILNDTQCIVPRCANSQSAFYQDHLSLNLWNSIDMFKLKCMQESNIFVQHLSLLWSPPKLNVFSCCAWTRSYPSPQQDAQTPQQQNPCQRAPSPLRKCDPHLVSLAAPHQLEPKGTPERRCDVAVFNQQGVAKTAYRSCSSSPVFAWSWLISISCNQIGNHASSHLVHGPTHNHIASSTCRLETPRLRLLFHASLCLLEMIVSVSWLAHLQPCLYESWS